MEKAIILVFLIFLSSCSSKCDNRDVNFSIENKINLKIFIEHNKSLMDSIKKLPKLSKDSIYVCSVMDFDNFYRIQLMKQEIPYYIYSFNPTYIYNIKKDISIVVTGSGNIFKKMDSLSVLKYDFLSYDRPKMIKDVWGEMFFYVCKEDSSIIKVYTAKENQEISFGNQEFIRCLKQ